ncbi:MAG: hypothetical protein H0W06_10875 [Chloroflexia bacterium]|nr:hypothetical protein [Chloroflexia bacterium]
MNVEGSAAAAERYAIQLVAYFYEFATPNGREVMSFHWTPEAPDPTAIRFPHVHIGPALLGGQTVLRPGDLHRAHIPTGRISLPAVIRLAISEFRVFPLLDDWEFRLSATEALLSAEAHG